MPERSSAVAGVERSHVTAHVLDAANGVPAVGVAVALLDGTGRSIAQAVTDDNGRVSSLGPASLDRGTFSLVFETGAYFEGRGTQTFYPRVEISFELTATEEHYHIPILLSPFAFTTYRGS